MNFKIILIIILFLYSCDSRNINISKRDIITPDISYSNKGFTLVFDESLKKKKLLIKKLEIDH